MQVEGFFQPQFAPVIERFRAVMAEPGQRGAALCVQLAGETLIDVWAGVQDRAGRQPWQRDTLVSVFSCGKPILAVVVLQLVQEGRLALDAPVASYWPEFGKQEITVRDLLTHQSGLPAIEQALPAEALYNWQQMAQALSEQSPWWRPGTAHGYAPMTYGWLLGELVQRLEGQTVGQVIARRIGQPLSAQLYVGVPQNLWSQISDTSRIKGACGDEAAQQLMQAMMQTKTLTGRAFGNPPSMFASSNKPQWRELQQPAASTHANARGLAAFYMGLLQGKLLEPELLAEMQHEHAYGPDKVLLATTRFGLGCMLEQPQNAAASFGLGGGAFGHPGAGGSLGCAAPERQLSMAFVTNSLDVYVAVDPRPRSINQVLMSCI